VSRDIPDTCRETSRTTLVPSRALRPAGGPISAVGQGHAQGADDLYRFLARETSRKPTTVLRWHTVLRAAVAQAVRWGWLDRNPIERAAPPMVHSIETVPPTVVNVLRVLDRAAASRNRENAVVFRMVAATGCRRGGVCALKWSDVDLDGDAARMVIRGRVLHLEGRRTVHDTKTHALR
jgi:integrase